MLFVYVLFFIIMFDCCRKGWENWYLVMFVVFILWMVFILYVLVWIVFVIGEIFDIFECIMGLMFLVVGLSVLDVVVSFVVVKYGMGDMVLVNCVGSNIFDIFCLGLLWFFVVMVVYLGSVVLIYSGYVVYMLLCLFGIVFVIFLVIYFNYWNLDKCFGYMFLVIYFLFLFVVVIFEVLLGGDVLKLNLYYFGYLLNKGFGYYKNVFFKKVM